MNLNGLLETESLTILLYFNETAGKQVLQGGLLPFIYYSLTYLPTGTKRQTSAGAGRRVVATEAD